MRRELAQIAAQRTTYILRALYAAGVALFGLIYFYSVALRHGMQRMSAYGYGYYGMGYGYGMGRRMLTGIIGWSLGSVMVLLPAMVVGSVTSEREQGTLDLMRISRLSPWEIVLQKYFARLVPFCTFLLLLIPLCAVAYSLGGISVKDLIESMATLLSAVLRIAAVSLLCSALCSTTVSAFLSAYFMLFVIFAALPFFFYNVLRNAFGYYGSDWMELWVFGPWLNGSRSTADQAWYVIELMFGIVACLLCTCLLLGRTRRPRGAFAKRLHRWLDLWMERMNRLVGNVRWGGKEPSLPDANPVAWRERSRATVCIPRHMFRLLCLVSVPTFFILALIWIPHSIYRYSSSGEGFSFFLMCLWIPAVLVPAVYVANLISGERSDQTFDVLLTTPIEPYKIIQQKMAAVPRLVFLVTLPMIMTILAKFFCVYWGRDTGKGIVYLLFSFSGILIYEWLVVWIALHASLRARRRSVVVLLTLVSVIGFICVPLLLAFLINMASDFDSEGLFFLSPVGVFMFSEFDCDMDYVLWVIVGLGAYFCVALKTCRYCMNNAERLLSRPPPRR